MNLKKYISKHFLMRFCLLLALVGSAALFDVYHSTNRELPGSNRKTPVSNEAEANKVFFCSQVPSYNLKPLGTDFSVRFHFACTQDKFLLKYYNLRTFQLMKAETLQVLFPMVCSFQSLSFNRVLYASPDDTPPLV
jgi:hypothetical protein